MELEGYLDILMALTDGADTPAAIADRAGLTVNEATEEVHLLTRYGFLDRDPELPSRLRVSPLGRRLLESGYDECYKRALLDRLGGDGDSAS